MATPESCLVEATFEDAWIWIMENGTDVERNKDKSTKRKKINASRFDKPIGFKCTTVRSV